MFERVVVVLIAVSLLVLLLYYGNTEMTTKEVAIQCIEGDWVDE